MQITSNERTFIIAAAGYVATAVISTMPAKDSNWTWQTVYCWFFDFAHMLLNSRPTKDAAK